MYYDERKEVVAETQTPAPDLDQWLLQATEPLLHATEPWRLYLLAAAESLRTHGWCQGLAQVDDRRCVQSAIGYAIGFNNSEDYTQVQFLAFDMANKKLRQYLGLPCSASTYMWNDIPGRTVEQVIAALEGAARA